MAPISGIIFDLDGTLIDSAPDIAIALNRVRDHLSLPPLEYYEVRPLIGDGALKLIQRGVFGLVDDPALKPQHFLPRTGTDIDEVLELFQGFYSEDPVIETKVVAGVETSLRYWQQKGVALVCLTNKPYFITTAVLRLLGITNYFDLVVGRGTLDDEGNMLPAKPDAAIIDYIIDQTGAPRDELILVGDGLPDLETAKNAGIPFLALLCGYTDPDVMLAAVDNLEMVCTSFVDADEWLRTQA